MCILTSANCLLHPFQIQKGVSSARSDDTKSMKGAVLDWITPRDVSLNPPLSRNVKTNRGYHHNTTGALLCPAGMDWNDPESKPCSFNVLTCTDLLCRVRAKLVSGAMAVPGDQWPMLLYADQKYDPDDPWNGLFRSQLLVWVSWPFKSSFVHIAYIAAYRRTSTSSPHPVQ